MLVAGRPAGLRTVAYVLRDLRTGDGVQSVPLGDRSESRTEGRLRLAENIAFNPGSTVEPDVVHPLCKLCRVADRVFLFAHEAFRLELALPWLRYHVPGRWLACAAV
jgi:hypothetical protein